MKKLIKKHLSIILSFAIILTTLLPVLTGLGSVAALSAEEQVVVDNLKAAWEQMTTKPTSVLYPNYKFPNGSKTHMGSNIYTTANQATLPYGATADMLGTYYVTEHNYNVTNTTSNLDSNQRILFYGNIDNANNAEINVTAYDSFYFNIYFEELTSDLIVYANVVAGSANNRALAKGYTITADKKGSWVTIKDTDLINGGFAALSGTDKLNGLQLSMKTASTSTTVEVVVGSLQFVKNVPVPADSETANWTFVDWLKAALKVDLSLCGNTEDFITALAAAKSAFGEKYAIANLIKEWEALSVYHNPDINPNRWWNTSGSVVSANMTSGSAYTGTLPANVDLGANYATFTGLGNAAGIGSKQCVLYEFCKDGSGSSITIASGKSSVPVNTIGDIYFWFKADNMAADITLNIQVMTNDTTAKNQNLPAFVIPSSKSGQWVKISLKEIGGTEWYGALNEKLFRIMVAMSNANGATVTVGSGRIIVPDACPVPANVENTATAWLTAAMAVDTSACVDATDFNNAVKALKEYSSEDPRVTLAAKELVEAWNNLSRTDIYNILPNRWWGPNGGSAISANMADSSTYAETLPEGVELGDKYAVFTGLGDVAATESKQCLLYEFKDGSSNTFGGNDRTSYNIDTIANVYFWIKIDNMTKDANLRIKVRGHSGGEYLIPETVTIPASKSGQWVKISLKDETSGSWCGTIASQPFYRVMFALNNVSGATVTAGSGMIQTKVGVPEGVENMTPEALLLAAMEVNLNEYGNTEQFVEKLEALKLYCEDAVAIVKLKNAVSALRYTDSTNILPNRWYNVSQTVESANMADSSTYTDALPDGVDLGEKYAVFTGLGDTSALERQQSVIMEFKNGSDSSYEGKERTPYDISEVKDVYFWIKFDNMTKDAYIRLKVLGHGTGGSNLLPESVIVPKSKSGEWFKISLNEISGPDWNNGVSNGLYRVLVALNNAAGATVTIGSGYVDVGAVKIAAQDDWTLADWIIAASKIDASSYIGAEEFEAALEYAKDVRDRLMIARGSNLTEYDDINSANIDGATIAGDNILETLLPAIYHSADGISKVQVESAAPELFTDGDSNTIGTVTGLDNSNEKSFTQFIYKFEGEANITDLMVYNDVANLADKYYIYVSDSESALFTQENLMVAYKVQSGKAAQRFNFDGKPDVRGVYIGIRAYSSGDTVSFAEFKALGEVVTYEIEKGNFSNNKIADIGDNLLDDIAPKIKTLIKFDWKTFVGTANGYLPGHLTDDNAGTPVGMSNTSARVYKQDETISVHIYYDLGTTYSIEKLLVNNWDQKGLETGKYEIYASKDINSLFMTRNKILSYDNMVDGPNSTTVSQLFTLKNDVVARYISFHITYPISDWDYCETNKGYGQMYWIRLSELGVYGTEWVKPYALVNLTSHVPMDVYRTDASGTSKEVSEDEYTGSEHKFTYDGNAATYADLKIKNGETINFVYNLAAEMNLEEVNLKLNSGTVKKMNIYSATVEDNIWKQESLIYSDSNGLGKTSFGKGFAEIPLKARYLRFEILENDGEDLQIAEIEAIGGNDQEFNYMNLIEENPDSATFYLQDVGKGGFAATTPHGKKWLGSWKSWNGLYPIQKAFDNDHDTVYDIFGGKNGEESVNILLDLGTLNSIDDITLVAGSEPEYWPDEMNYYFGDDSVALFDKDAKPAKKWVSSTENGVFTYEFVPQVAQYVRIEFVRCEDPVYSQYFDYVSAIIAELGINGLELKSRAVNGIAAVVEDKETGIKAEILALRENDVYDAIQSMTVIKRAPTDEELASAKSQGLKLDTDIYEIYFIDANGDIVTDTGDREVVIYIPEKLSSITEDIFVLSSEFGGLSMIEFDAADGYYYFTVDDISYALNVALGYMVEDEEEFEDIDDSDDEDFEDEDEFEEDEDDEEDEEETKRKKIKKVRVNRNELNYALIIILAAVVVVVIAAGVVLFIVLKKKKNKENEE